MWVYTDRKSIEIKQKQINININDKYIVASFWLGLELELEL